MLKTAMPSKQTHPFTQANTTKGFAAHELLELLIAQAAEHGGAMGCCNPPPQRKIGGTQITTIRRQKYS